jgi:hypothetical protein
MIHLYTRSAPLPATPTATSKSCARAAFALCFALLLALVTSGCTASSKYMFEPRLPVPNVAPPNAALVVFVRPSGYARGEVTTILEDQGAFLGDSVAETHFAVAVAPGPHLFFSWGENTAPLIANLLPGRVYYVEVSPRPGFFSSRVQLLAITPRSPNWKELGTWLSESSQLIPDTAAGQAYLNGRREAVAERIRRARERAGELDAEERAARTLQPEDGVLAAAPALQAQQAPAPTP